MNSVTCTSCGTSISANPGQTITCPSCGQVGTVSAAGPEISGFGSNMGWFFGGVIAALIIPPLFHEGKKYAPKPRS